MPSGPILFTSGPNSGQKGPEPGPDYFLACFEGILSLQITSLQFRRDCIAEITCISSDNETCQKSILKQLGHLGPETLTSVNLSLIKFIIILK
jgi:hypothetical protein